LKLTKADIKQLEHKGISKQEILDQIEVFENGIPFIDLRDPATISNGIEHYAVEALQQYVSIFEDKCDALDLLKFVPASGAATRMFKFLFQFLEDYDLEKESTNAYINRKNAQDLRLFFVGLDNFPFYKNVRKELVKAYNDGVNININRVRFVKMMLEKEGLHYGNYPKGLFPFHRYPNHIASAFEEHLYEASLYIKSRDKARLHFTISENHHKNFKEAFEHIQHHIEETTGTSFDCSYSFQSPTTDTIAVDLNNEPFRDENNQLIFRPGGHGALITNLNALEADIIFIKNIDNVVSLNYGDEVAVYKKVLAGKLLQLQERAFHYMQILESVTLPETEILEIVHFLQDEFHLKLARDFEKFSEKYQIQYLQEQLDRPIRICGMVKNEGEPGGGPFWVKHESGRVSLQIVESCQVNHNDPLQYEIFKSSSHFNPVDIICGVKDYKGKKYDLLKFIDPKAGFITEKTIDGTPIKALEHPGLWNGAMAHWNTIFVEVPLITFNPVKTVNDLLKPAHQISE